MGQGHCYTGTELVRRGWRVKEERGVVMLFLGVVYLTLHKTELDFVCVFGSFLLGYRNAASLAIAFIVK